MSPITNHLVNIQFKRQIQDVIYCCDFSLFYLNSCQLLILKIKGMLNLINPLKASSLKHALGRDVIKTVVVLCTDKYSCPSSLNEFLCLFTGPVQSPVHQPQVQINTVYQSKGSFLFLTVKKQSHDFQKLI